MNKETIVFGGGCFWCTEAIFKTIAGVDSVTPGYSGGHVENPTYEQVCSGNTGHAECTKVDYDPNLVSFRDLLTVFFGSHDSTTLNRQGNDVGTQYRSVVFYTTDKQKEQVEEFIKEINSSNTQGATVTTEVKLLEKFYEAENYHKDYFAKNPEMAYCQIIINPKLDKVKKEFSNLLKSNE